MIDVPLKCQCGEVRGTAKKVSPNVGSRIICCCNDCQQFADFLRSDNTILDKHGGTDIFQMPMSYVEIDKGQEQLRCVRLTSKGPHRWYTDCCKTPIGNTMAANMPFIGVIHNFMDDEGVRDKNLGEVRARVQAQHAKEPYPEGAAPAFPFGIIVRIMSKMLVWKIKGLNKPSAFFEGDGKPVSEPKMLNS